MPYASFWAAAWGELAYTVTLAFGRVLSLRQGFSSHYGRRLLSALICDSVWKRRAGTGYDGLFCLVSYVVDFISIIKSEVWYSMHRYYQTGRYSGLEGARSRQARQSRGPVELHAWHPRPKH